MDYNNLQQQNHYALGLLRFGPKAILMFTWFLGIRGFDSKRKRHHVNALLDKVQWSDGRWSDDRCYKPG